jgi:hypothetical protein
VDSNSGFPNEFTVAFNELDVNLNIKFVLPASKAKRSDKIYVIDEITKAVVEHQSTFEEVRKAQ